MGLRIKESSLLTNTILKIDSKGITYSDIIGTKRKFGFGEIVCILMSEDNVLSFQVGEEVFKIRVKPGKKEHQAVIETFLREVRRATGHAVL